MKILEEEWFRCLELACSFGLIMFGAQNIDAYYKRRYPPLYWQAILFFYFVANEIMFIALRFTQILGVTYQRANPDSAWDEYQMFFILCVTSLFVTMFLSYRHIVFSRINGFEPRHHFQFQQSHNNSSAPRTSAASPVKIPAHAGDMICVICLDMECERVSAYHCGRYNVCGSCYPAFMHENHEYCPRCKAGRVY